MKKSLIVGLLAAGFILGFAGASALQEEGKPAGGGQEGGAESMMPPPPLEDPMSDKMVGNWKWTGTMEMHGQEMPMNAEETVKWAIGHQFLISKYKSFGPDGSVGYEALGVIRPNPETGESTMWWFDSYGTLTEFKGKREGNKEVAEGQAEGGKMRSTAILNEDGTIDHTMEMTEPGHEEYKPFFKVKGTKQ